MNTKEMTQEEHEKAVEKFFTADDPELQLDLPGVLYAMNELGLWPDHVDSVSEEQALLCWKIVEKLRTTPFPEDLYM